MMGNTKDTDSLFEKSFVKYPFSSEKNFDIRQVQQKHFFSIDSPIFKKAVEVLAFYISASSNSMERHVPSRSSKQFCNFVFSANLPE